MGSQKRLETLKSRRLRMEVLARHKTVLDRWQTRDQRKMPCA